VKFDVPKGVNPPNKNNPKLQQVATVMIAINYGIVKLGGAMYT
jgi:hypothetical protein